MGLVALVGGVWTAWRGLDSIQGSPAPVITPLCVSALFLLLAWVYRSRERTWFGSMVVLAGLTHTLVVVYAGSLDLPWLDALLAHATLAVLASVLLEAWVQLRPSRLPVDSIRHVFVKPLGETALLSSGLAVVVLPLVSWHNTISLAACLFWLAGIWMVIAATRRWPAMCAAAQAVLTLAAVVATTAWLQQHPWDPTGRVDLVDPRSLQAYGIGLALLTLLWIAARIGLGRNAVAEQLLNPGWPTVDRIVGQAMVVLQLLVLALHLLPGCLRELVAHSPGLITVRFPAEAFGSPAWALLGV
ncbi:MAG: hypothetical protein HQ582_13625, partial [Planctomycetes bacterium]|nr:hypothetical protein [Planctomycetota bacterium]